MFGLRCRHFNLRGSLVHRFGALVTLSLLSILLVACGGDGSERYDTLTQLRDAAVAAGLECPAWETMTRLDGSLRGDCSSTALVVLFSDQGQRDDAVDALREANDFEAAYSYPVLVGENWLVNSPQAPDLQNFMRGEVVTID